MEIVIVGTGNVAYILGRKLKAAGHNIVQVFGRNAAAASALAYELDTESTNYWSIVNQQADLYLVAVTDMNIEEVVAGLQVPHKTVIHTAGSVPTNVLQNITENYGVLYPLQSLKRETDHLPDIPLLIDAGNEITLHKLQALAHSISNKVVIAGDAERLKLHLAAVFCNNFVNHLYALMENFCRQENIDFDLLKPLIRETALRIENLSPQKAQTGPAIRRDTATIEKHLQLLQQHPQLAQLYQLFTQSIEQTSII